MCFNCGVGFLFTCLNKKSILHGKTPYNAEFSAAAKTLFALQVYLYMYYADNAHCWLCAAGMHVCGLSAGVILDQVQSRGVVFM
jgi:hypothetical protein